MNTPAKIKAKIKTLLEEITEIKEVFYEDYKKNVFEMDIATYPIAQIYAPSLETSSRLDNRTNIREYVFTVSVLFKPENFETNNEIEDLMDILFDKFDNNYTLDGEADGGVEPSIMPAEAISHVNGNYAAFDLILRAKHTRTLTYTP